MIEFKNVSKIFKLKDKNLKAVQNVNLKINNGEIYGIIGYSGAGKSTLVRMLNGLETPTTGQILIGKHNISDLSTSQLRIQRKKIGMIFQHFNLLWSRTVLKNVALPLEIAGVSKEKRLQKARKLLSLVGLENRGNDYPSELSGGQKQRVGIARALANDPKILISDEATSALDPETTDDILDLLTDINKRLGITIILITHEMHAVRKVASKVAVMKAGRIVEKGSLIDIFTHPKNEVTKQFVNKEANGDEKELQSTLDNVIHSDPKNAIIRLIFNGSQSGDPVVSSISKKYQIQISIIQGNVKQTRNGAIGSLIIQLIGNHDEQEKVIEYLQKLQIETEVIYHE
ncbi:methionine import ATP-binding protein MetN 2 [Philodulcilactobacillus myokoensis]|uniref:Methionine import ATP-binding protein MetN 2 n=1 Tax=Philodulcilactobacillus myokoensis TaxID=2929573 RepID=A0A9W6B327_9LACO|nr:ATP-binding cassette domain-containing protein [Philodulcilactobacillus myokoensis]GLB47069.1 methionine import ATP-binding protein MetN 2 [Philodulcilactobacillus myokoensis]